MKQVGINTRNIEIKDIWSLYVYWLVKYALEIESAYNLLLNYKILMDSERKSELWVEAINAYNLLGMSGFETWADSYEGNRDEKNFLRGICDYLYRENTRGERVFSLRGVNLESIMGKVS